MVKRLVINVAGIVQSVGFRPFVFALANRTEVQGVVRNTEQGVLIDIEGDDPALDRFLEELKSSPPPLSQIDSLTANFVSAAANYSGFRILDSSAMGAAKTSVAPDVSICQDCFAELFDPSDRRYRYPFINCTNCGPRYTIIEALPYDRPNTTMREFEMCADCRREYEDPTNRRFHAEPIACGKCGPTVYLRDASGRIIANSSDAICRALESLSAGKILAIKGIGGYHLVCDATSESAVARLRARKYREDKPFAMMAPGIDVIRQYCDVSAREEAVLVSRARPIVLLDRCQGHALAGAVAPAVNRLGFMLPYSPLHCLLFETLGHPLVMTSANVSDEPICFTDEDAFDRLAGIADEFLYHNRRIHIRMDDSVVRIEKYSESHSIQQIRRSRGFAPAPVHTSFVFEKAILACGAELKNTFCLAREHNAYLSQHIGDLENLETYKSFTEGIEHLCSLLQMRPEVVAYDLHPEYLSTKYALACDVENRIGIQHHHAHIAACMADNEIDGEVIGIALDGLGFGTDGRMWGGEFFAASFDSAERIAHLEYMPMPGGMKAIREPWRMGASYLFETFGTEFTKIDIPFVRTMDQSAWNTLKSMITSRTNCPETSSMGRLFDAVSSMLGLRSQINYEGQAAIELEQIAAVDCAESYSFDLKPDGMISADPIIRSAVEDIVSGIPASIVSAKFHQAVARLIVDMSVIIRQRLSLNRVTLSGGVFQNAYLLKAAIRGLNEAGFQIFIHHRVPSNDGGISLGQAAIANRRIRK